MSIIKLILKIVCALVVVAGIATAAYFIINKLVNTDEDDWDEFDCFECECEDCEGCELAEADEAEEATEE